MPSKRNAPVAAAGWSIVFAATAFALLQTMSEVLGLFDLRLEIKILLMFAVALGTLAFNVRDKAPGVATKAAWLLSGAMFVGALGLGVITGFEIQSIDEQIRNIRRQASRDGKTVFEFAAAAFQGGEAKSRLFYFEDKRNVFGSGAPLPSGEIRIYDERDEDLKEAFRFQPEGGRTAVFRYRFLGDLDSDGDDELIGGYGRPQELSEALLPFAVYWDDEAGRYAMRSLQTEPPDRHLQLEPRPNASALRDGYRERVTFQDASEGQSITGYRVQDFAITNEPARLISGLAVDARTPTRVGEVELAVNQIRFTGNEPTLVPCRLRAKKPLRAPWSSDRALSSVLAERWKREDPACQPIFSTG
jgi:hypothetical protein